MSNALYSKKMSLENFEQIDVRIDPEYGIVWVYQNPSPRPPATVTSVSTSFPRFHTSKVLPSTSNFTRKEKGTGDPLAKIADCCIIRWQGCGTAQPRLRPSNKINKRRRE